MSPPSPTQAEAITSPNHPLPAPQGSLNPASVEPVSAAHQASSRPGPGLDRAASSQTSAADPDAQAVDGQPSRPVQQQSTPDSSVIGKPDPATDLPTEPPTNDLPPLPVRNYEAYQDLAYKNPSAGLNSNRILIRFLFSLSNFVFFGGSLAGLVVFVYQRYFFPRLVLRNAVLLSLKTSAFKSYSLFLDRITELARSNPTLYRAGSKSGVVDGARSGLGMMEPGVESESGRANRSEGLLEANKTDQPVPVKPASKSSADSLCGASSTVDEPVANSQSASSDSTPSPAHINQPIYDSLASLSASLRRRQNGRSSSDSETQPARAVQGLVDSIERFRFDLHNKHSAHLNAHSLSSPKSFYFTKPSRPPALAVEAQPVASDHTPEEERARRVIEENKKALGDFKAEIRALKGMLLNRRNFAGWRTTAVGS